MEFVDKQIFTAVENKLRRITTLAIDICSLLDRLANGDIVLTPDTEDPENGIYTIEQFLHIIHNNLYCGLELLPPPPLEEVDCMYALDI